MIIDSRLYIEVLCFLMTVYKTFTQSNMWFNLTSIIIYQRYNNMSTEEVTEAVNLLSAVESQTQDVTKLVDHLLKKATGNEYSTSKVGQLLI